MTFSSDLSSDQISKLGVKEKKLLARRKMAPLLDACDGLRNDLRLSGLQVKVCHFVLIKSLLGQTLHGRPKSC